MMTMHSHRIESVRTRELPCIESGASGMTDRSAIHASVQQIRHPSGMVVHAAYEAWGQASCQNNGCGVVQVEFDEASKARVQNEKCNACTAFHNH